MSDTTAPPVAPETTPAAVLPSPVDLGEDGPVEVVIDSHAADAPLARDERAATFAELVSVEHGAGHLLQMHAMELASLAQKAAEFKAAAAGFRSKASADFGAILDVIIHRF